MILVGSSVSGVCIKIGISSLRLEAGRCWAEEDGHDLEI